jgi:hypothetical protein
LSYNLLSDSCALERMGDKQEYDSERVVMEPGEDELPDLLATDLRGYFELVVLRYASQLYAFALRCIREY